MRQWLEYLGGVTDEPPGGAPGLGTPGWGLVWVAYALVAWVFSGQSSRFIYIDF